MDVSSDLRGGGEKAEEGEGGCGFAGTGLAYEAQRFTGGDFKREVLDGGMGAELYFQVVDPEERLLGHCGRW